MPCRNRIEFIKWSDIGDNDQQTQDVFSVPYIRIVYNYSP